ncbi:unnamed protein product [Ixodes pacificus]
MRFNPGVTIPSNKAREDVILHTNSELKAFAKDGTLTNHRIFRNLKTLELPITARHYCRRTCFKVKPPRPNLLSHNLICFYIVQHVSAFISSQGLSVNIANNL